MAEPASLPEFQNPALAEFEHPRGTMAIVVIFGLLFAFGWMAMYFLMFLKRGAMHM